MAELTKEQTDAYDKIHAWLKIPAMDSWQFRLGGFAGTGKTFLLQQFINTCTHEMVCCTPTGKAAAVLSAKLNGHHVSTIHKILYTPFKMKHDEVERLTKLSAEHPENQIIKDKLEDEIKKARKNQIGFSRKDDHGLRPGNLIIVDESSMVTERMRNDLENTECKVLFVGDPGQLPPVGGGDWFVGGEFDYILQTVQRQALDSPILRMSLDIRKGVLSSPDYQTADCRIITKKQMGNDEWQTYDQALTGRNATRHRINRFFRRRIAGGEPGPLPMKGERMAFCKNEDYLGSIITNGAQFVTDSDYSYDEDSNSYELDADYDGVKLKAMRFYDFHCRLTYDDKVTDTVEWKKRGMMREIDYAYCVTVHKSQGSEWDSVILADDNMQSLDKIFRRRWLYTAVTRAKKRLVWITGVGGK